MLLVPTIALGAIALALPPVRGVEASASSCAASPAPISAPSLAGEALDSEPVRLTARDGRKLEGTFYPVPKVNDPVAAVLLIHDLGADRAQLEPLVERLVKKKLAVLTFDLRGHGASADEECDWSAMDEAAQSRLVPFMVHDIGAAMEWLSDDSRVLGARQHVIGQGFGALLAARAAADERVTSLTLIEPQLDAHNFQLAGLLDDAAGLPMQLVAPKDACERYETFLKDEELEDVIEIQAVKCDAGECAGDKRFGTSLSKWVDDRRDGATSGTSGGKRKRG
ncbi:Alpha/beta hydrolase family protein [Planctomycetes bacterium Pla163]|uniref:Alpha/beta hydrolase family protein n=1 Tax=Rohdeia mirabilis TaxID=2528008 RepID=A0A518D1T5_9BACT|nr:Alpha/beta hydrolase family protein [Planctomycetes bacterium Pla163]